MKFKRTFLSFVLTSIVTISAQLFVASPAEAADVWICSMQGAGSLGKGTMDTYVCSDTVHWHKSYTCYTLVKTVNRNTGKYVKNSYRFQYDGSWKYSIECQQVVPVLPDSAEDKILNYCLKLR